jgi:hypothetical protein
MESLTQIASSMRSSSIREDWCQQIENADKVIEAAKDALLVLMDKIPDTEERRAAYRKLEPALRPFN